MRTLLTGTIVLASIAVMTGKLLAGPDSVVLPANYQAEFVNYMTVDHLARKRVRKMYVNPQAHATARAQQALPDGTVLIMEDHEAKTDAQGNLVRDTDGRLIPLDPVTNMFVMEKNAAWSTDNEHWDYAWYQADGKLKPGAKYDGCFSCHTGRAERDFTFTYWKFVADSAK